MENGNAVTAVVSESALALVPSPSSADAGTDAIGTNAVVPLAGPGCCTQHTPALVNRAAGLHTGADHTAPRGTGPRVLSDLQTVYNKLLR